jgi:hypothetical protein
MSYCSYFQATVSKKDTWFFVATVRSYDHMMFDRTIDTTKGLFEFFVPLDYESQFLQVMDYYIRNNIVHDLKKMENRLIQEAL